MTETAKLSPQPKGRPISGRGEYYRKYINHDKMTRLEALAAKDGRDPKAIIDDMIEVFFRKL